MSSSVTGPAVMPSGGLVERFLYSWKRRFCATEDIVDAVLVACVRGRGVVVFVVFNGVRSRLLYRRWWWVLRRVSEAVG